MSDFIQSNVVNGVQTIRLNRASKKNAITLDMYQGLTQSLEEGESNKDILVTVIHGEGADFSSGNDIAEFVQIAQQPDKMSTIMAFLRTLSQYPKPLFAAVEGRAVGIGATMLLHCDMVFAARNSSLCFPFVKLGVVPEAAVSYLLPSLAGHQLSFEKLILGEPFDAEEAHSIGMINHLCEDDEAFALAMKYAEKTAKLPPEAVLLSKSLLKQRFQDEVQMTLMREGRIFKDRLQSKEAHNAFKRFLSRPKVG
ncbi:enoyl-CoA hydratase-related protein [Marinomonas sp. 15G1-11]|uniref:Enoyl-CoA hydratase-related protein n=1 Tax=Marinomonas phaeophyticola TaxID=3004091 RepID=A0ABT4JSS8_9GAMM|nr:enoyl-CoA hydratase-related protein [Marinomonas sp. 15G1-11]MCZ2720659.1 enoyl-CoA hydratase-related protein [Marinomonas sp. 15G1-11]